MPQPTINRRLSRAASKARVEHHDTELEELLCEASDEIDRLRGFISRLGGLITGAQQQSDVLLTEYVETNP